jgi:hypothetical protein
MEECELGPNGCALQDAVAMRTAAVAVSKLPSHHSALSIIQKLLQMRLSCTHVYRGYRGLLYCMEYLEDNLHEWLAEELAVRFHRDSRRAVACVAGLPGPPLATSDSALVCINKVQTCLV